MFSRMKMNISTESYSDKIKKLKELISEADAVVLGAGAGLSTSAGFTYDGYRFRKYFSDFNRKYGIEDMYSGGFYHFENERVFWAWWSRHIWVNRYIKAPKKVYDELYELLKDKDYFVITTNADHQFQISGFSKDRLYYMQGDYGLIQCSEPCHSKTYDNYETVRKMILDQGFTIGEDNELIFESLDNVKMEVSENLIPHCPVCGKSMTLNLRGDSHFAEDPGNMEAQRRYKSFIEDHGKGKVLLIEIGVGGNTPAIIKYPFWILTRNNSNFRYVCINRYQAGGPEAIESRALYIREDTGKVIRDTLKS